MKKSLRSVALVALLSASTSLFAATTGGDPVPHRDAPPAGSSAIVIVITALLGL